MIAETPRDSHPAEERGSVPLLAEDEKVRVLRAFLKRWKFDVGAFFDGVGPESTDEQLLAIAPRLPALEVESD